MNRLLSVLMLCGVVAPALGQCSANFSYNGFTPEGGPISDLSLLGDASLQDGVLRLTPNQEGQAGAAWYRLSKASVGDGFTVTFRFQISGGSADGFAFVIQNESSDALGAGGSDIGYGSSTRSLAVEFDTYNFEGEFPSPHMSIQTGGNGQNTPDDANSLGHTQIGFDIADGFPHDVQITYVPGLMTVVVDNSAAVLVTPVDLHSLMGDDILEDEGNFSQCAWVGFTAATGAATADQDILNWAYFEDGIGECAANFAYGEFDGTTPLNYVGSAALVNNAIRLTDGGSSEAGAAWYIDSLAEVGNGFATEFTFRIVNGCADGLAFVIQRGSAGELGGDGSGLGYGDNLTEGIRRSLAVEFDTFGFGGEISTPHISVQSNGNGSNSSDDSYSLGSLYVGDTVTLCDGLPHTVRIEYVPGVMRVILDGDQMLQVPVDLHDINGEDILFEEIFSQCAFIGFTAATGGAIATQEILSWSFDDTFIGTGCIVPQFSVFPDPSTRTAGQYTEFHMEGSGTGPLGYQWYLNGSPLQDDGRINGAQTDTLSFDPILSSDWGQLDFSISNACGGISSGFELSIYCFADFNQDGGVDGGDVVDFFVQWEAGDSSADVNEDGGVDGGDIDTFFQAWSAGGCG